MINKMYNPFKWHIITNGVGKYVIRRRGWFGWKYLDQDGEHEWCVIDNMLRWCIFPSLIEAEDVFQKLPIKWTYLKS